MTLCVQRVCSSVPWLREGTCGGKESLELWAQSTGRVCSRGLITIMDPYCSHGPASICSHELRSALIAVRRDQLVAIADQRYRESGGNRGIVRMEISAWRLGVMSEDVSRGFYNRKHKLQNSNGGLCVNGRLAACKFGSGAHGIGQRVKVHENVARCRRVWVHAMNTNSGKGPYFQTATDLLHLAASLGSFLLLDRLLKNAFVAGGIRFPSALFGMFNIFILLLIIDLVNHDTAEKVIAVFQPAITFIQRWLPLFYVPSLVVVPLALKGIPAAASAKIFVLLVVGWAASLAVAGYAAMTVRTLVRTELLPVEVMPKPIPFSARELKILASTTAIAFVVAVLSPTAFGTTALTAIPYFLSATAVGYIVGSNLPTPTKKILHPIITCAVTADLAAFVYGAVTGQGFEAALGNYLTKSSGNPGAGDVLMGVLGSVILSFAFSMFRQRKLVQRHAAEIFSAVVASSIFSLYSTAAAGRVLGLAPSLTSAIIPRCVTVALALPIASLLEGQHPTITAAVVVLTGLVGANFAQSLMDMFGFKDPITRGMATASSAHGLGTAALSAKEPEAVPFCAIAYALTGIFCSVLCAIPVVQQSLLALAGHSW